MSDIIEAIDVDVPVRVAYDQWTQFEEFPQFMDGIDAVYQMDDRTLDWHAAVGGVTTRWRAKITEQLPDHRIAWESIDGARNSGVVTFHRLDDARTRVTLQLGVEPEGTAESIADALGLVRNRATGDLARFKDFIEERGSATGSWRGTIHPASSAG